MRKTLLGSLAAWLACAGLALAQYSTVTAGRPATQPTNTAVAGPPPATAPAPPAGVSVPPGVGGAVVPAPGPDCAGGHGPGDCAGPCPPACCEQPCPPPDNCPCGPPGHCWVRAEYLLWWVKHGSVPPLITTGGPVTAPGVLGAPGTTVLVGDEGFVANDNPFSGGRFTAGTWLDECQTFGIEGGYFFLGRGDRSETVSSSGAPGTPILARPFFNVLTGQPDAQLIAFPGVLAGTATVSSSTRLQGAEGNTLCNLCCCNHGCEGGYRVDFISGFRWLQLDERLTIAEDLTVLPTGDRITLVDEFRTRNNFYGGQLGLRGEVRRGRLFADARALVALGTTEQTVDINGTTVFTPAGGAPQALAGGLLALPTNIGHFRRNHFAVVPEVGFNVGYQVTPYVRVFVGYTFLYWSNVVRPGDVIDLAVNPRQIPTAFPGGPLVGPARPAFQFRDSDIWAQGINFGLELRF